MVERGEGRRKNSKFLITKGEKGEGEGVSGERRFIFFFKFRNESVQFNFSGPNTRN